MRNYISKTPWKLHTCGTLVTDSDGDVLASCGLYPHKSVYEWRGNAAFISMAPDVYEVLRNLVLAIDPKNNGEYSIDLIIDDAVDLIDKINKLVDLDAKT